MVIQDQTLVNWDVAPAEWQIANCDEPKWLYRKKVDAFVRSKKPSSIRKTTFYTISTNVLCADPNSSRDTIDPIDRDIYLPLEIAICKWSLKDGELQEMKYKHWMVDPGPPIRLCNSEALEHKNKTHKIEYNTNGSLADANQNQHALDFATIMKEINCFLSAERMVFSISLRNVRQDLGCLKWLNQRTNYKTKPIKVYSLEDLYVVLIRYLGEELYEKDELTSFACQGSARRQLECSETLNPKLQCKYHQVKASAQGDETPFCALAICQGYSRVVVRDITLYIATEV